MAQTPVLTEYTSHPPKSTCSLDDELFLERLDTFMQKSFNDIKAFAERESKPYDETRRRVAEWHAKTLFSTQSGGDTPGEPSIAPEDKSVRVRNVLIETSTALESLAAVTGIQSFILAVDPCDPQDVGFLGGSLIGREHFRGIRGGGTAGAIAFKTYAQKRLPMGQEEATIQNTSTRSSPAPQTARSARQAKVELYESIRSQLRKVSGIRKAEMKWTNPERLSLYGVRLVGWPSDIPAANPSSLKANQNQRLLDMVQNGELRFEKTMMTGQEALLLSNAMPIPDTHTEDFSWAYDADGGGDTSSRGYATRPASVDEAISMHVSQESMSDPPLPVSTDAAPAEEDDTPGNGFVWKGEDDDVLAAEHSDARLFDEYGFDINSWDGTVRLEDLEGDNNPIEQRARKRARSSENR